MIEGGLINPIWMGRGEIDPPTMFCFLNWHKLLKNGHMVGLIIVITGAN